MNFRTEEYVEVKRGTQESLLPAQMADSCAVPDHSPMETEAECSTRSVHLQSVNNRKHFLKKAITVHKGRKELVMSSFYFLPIYPSASNKKSTEEPNKKLKVDHEHCTSFWCKYNLLFS